MSTSLDLVFQRIRSGASPDPNGGKMVPPEAAAEVQPWLAVSEQLAAASAALPAANKQNLVILANIGVQYSKLQASTAKVLEAASGVDVPAVLAKIEAHLSARGVGTYLLGDGSLFSVADCAVATSMLDLITLVYSVQPFPHLATWFEACFSVEAMVAVTGPQRCLGTRRIGGQVDRRPDPVEAFKAASKSIALNQGQKKKKSQRQKEKDAKKKKGKASKKDDKGGVAASSSAAGTDQEVVDIPFKLGARADQSMDRDQRVAMVEAQLRAHGIEFHTESHAPTPTVDALVSTLGELAASDGGALCKNLFLKAKKKSRTREVDTKIWLVVACHDTEVNIKKLSKAFGYKDAIRMGRPDLLAEKLGVVQGQVSPLALMNNEAKDVQVILDAKMLAVAGRLWFHPLTFDASTGISAAGLQTWIEASGRRFEAVDFDSL